MVKKILLRIRIGVVDGDVVPFSLGLDMAQDALRTCHQVRSRAWTPIARAIFYAKLHIRVSLGGICTYHARTDQNVSNL